MNMSYTKPVKGALSDKMLLSVTETRDAEGVVRTMLLDGEAIYFRIRGTQMPPPLELLDFAVIASVFTAMRKGRALHVLGPVSRDLLRNLEEFQDAWSTWLPQYYRPIDITAEKEVEVPKSEEAPSRGVFAFSGGLDSTFAILRHARRSMGRRNVDPVLAVLVHGFDLPLGNDAALETARGNAGDILDKIGVPLVTVETNWKRDLCYNWRMEHIAGLAACLNQFHGMADIAIVGGDEGYDKVDIPWGSNPVSNPMLSGAMAFRTEGSSFKRTERLAFVAAQSNLASKIRVCWESAETGRNCGTCEKCIRTQMNFRAIGMEPQGFDRKAGFLRIAFIPTRSRGDNYFLMEAQKAAGRRKIYGWWRIAGYIGIAKNCLFMPLVLVKNKIKNEIRKNENLYLAIRKRRRHG